VLSGVFIPQGVCLLFILLNIEIDLDLLGVTHIVLFGLTDYFFFAS
jgi:hypothetical protein